MKIRSWFQASVLAAAVAAASGIALSQGGPPPGAGPDRGPGMMGGGQGPGMMGGGYGHGMMGGGHGHGMMGGGYGHGMMGGGPGMMGDYGALGLTDEQRQKLAALGEEARRRSWDAMGQVRTEQFRLRQLLSADPVNVQAVVDQQAKVDGLRRQVLKARVESRNEMAALLSPEQRKRLRESGPWWYREGAVE